MALTRSTARTRVLQRMDASGSSRWSTTAGSGEVDQLLTHVVDKEWRRILTHAPQVRLQSVSVTSSASTGRYAISDLSTGSGNSAKRFYKIRAVIIDNVVYRESKFEDYSLGETLDLAINVWWREEDSIMTLPKQLSKAATFWVTHLPVQVEDLASDSDNIVFPDGYEELYLLEAAALLLAKGGAETGAAAELKMVAEDIRNEMLNDLSRVGSGPLRQKYEDSSYDWGGS